MAETKRLVAARRAGETDHTEEEAGENAIYYQFSFINFPLCMLFQSPIKVKFQATFNNLFKMQDLIEKQAKKKPRAIDDRAKTPA